jgi:SWI/SNF-related matrix-associated actin-dependent regulator 1 of chromatin subfamily A
MNKLFPFQDHGAEWLASRNRAYLADEMGLGKTVQIAAAAGRRGFKSARVLCPASAVGVWEKVWPQWTTVPLEVVTYTKLAKTGWQGYEITELLVLDEAHYCKNTTADRTDAALHMANRSPCVWMASGTPSPNHVGEWYAPLRAVWPDLLREVDAVREADFVDKFCETRPTRWGYQVTANKNVPLLKAMLRKIVLRRMGEDVLPELPPVRWDNVEIEAYPDVVEAIEEHNVEELIFLQEMLAGDNMPLPTSLPALRHAIGVAKARPAAKLIARELEDGAYEKVVVFAYHTEVIELLCQGLRKFGVYRIDGSTPPHVRKMYEEAFNDPTIPGGRVLVGQIQAAGTALTFTGAHNAVLVEQVWNPDGNVQAAKRIHRIGQDNPCRIRMLSLKDSIDQKVNAVLKRKIRLLDEIYL